MNRRRISRWEMMRVRSIRDIRIHIKRRVDVKRLLHLEIIDWMRVRIVRRHHGGRVGG